MTIRLSSKRRTRASRPKNRHALPRNWLDSVPNRSSRPRRRANGRLVPVRNAASAINGRSRAITVRHGGDSEAPRLGRFDGRSAAGKAHRQRVADLTTHLGGNLSPVQRVLVDRAARLGILVELCADELAKTGAFKRGQPTAAFDAFLKVQADEERVLRLLGLESKRTLPRLRDVLKGSS